MEVAQLWQCPVCDVYFEDEDTARNHCPLFTILECGSNECEHETELEAQQCSETRRDVRK